MKNKSIYIMNEYEKFKNFVIKPKKTHYKGFLSQEQIETHFYKHHLGYASKIGEISSEEHLYQEICKHYNKETTLSNNLQQVFNHNLMWKSLGEYKSQENIRKTLNQRHNLEEKIKKTSVFGSGWLWILKEEEEIIVKSTEKALMPEKKYIILGNIDLWEHAYYIDYQWKRADYMNKYLDFLNYKLIKKIYDENSL